MLASAAQSIAGLIEGERVEEALRRSQGWLAMTLESIGDALIATDDAGRVVFMNPVAIQLTGWTIDDAKGRPLEEVLDIVNETTRERAESLAAELREGEERVRRVVEASGAGLWNLDVATGHIAADARMSEDPRRDDRSRVDRGDGDHVHRAIAPASRGRAAALSRDLPVRSPPGEPHVAARAPECRSVTIWYGTSCGLIGATL